MDELPVAFNGATHRLPGGAPVKATRWVKDGSHPAVERYPIERREYKGLLVASEKEKFALRFGEWVIEDGEGRIWVESSQDLPAGKYLPLEG
jgi:hypothetical protein